jgi:apolipoprotein N-acyltransferase
MQKWFDFLNDYKWVGDVFVFIAGGILVFAFAPFNLFPIAIVSQMILFLLWRGISIKRAFWRGWLYGVGMFGGGVHWLYISLAQFGGIDVITAIIINGLFVMGMALYPALLGAFILKVFPTCNRVRILLALPAGWVLLEWVRSWFLTGFPWLLLGYSQIDSPLAGLAPIGGVYAVSWAVSITAGLLLYGILRSKKGKIAWGSLIFLWTISTLFSFADWTRPLDKPLKVVLLQGNTSNETKFVDNFARQIIDNYLALTNEHLNVDVIVWPETAIPKYYHQVQPVIDEINQLSQEKNVDFIIGVPFKENNRYYNGVWVAGEKGGFYQKRHLVPFGEFIPFRELVKAILGDIDIPMSDFSSGALEQPQLQAKLNPLGISICYEDVFTWEIRRSMPNATLLVNLSNDGWFGDSIAPHQHLQIARMRALEMGRYMLRATNSGISAIINHKGQVVLKSPQFEESVVKGTVQTFDGGTPFSLSGNIPLLVLMLFSLFIAIILHYYWYPSHHLSESLKS